MANRVNKTACYTSSMISKKAVVASFDAGTTTRIWLEGLRDDQWYVTTFIPETRTVCMAVYSAVGTVTHVSLTLPITSNSTVRD